jgi:AcrR family transcriptional regulator
MCPMTSIRKLEIVEVATNLFKEKGYEGTSVRDIAAVIGIEAASLYSHISGKEEILQSICFDMAHKFLKAQEKVINSDIQDPKVLLHQVISQHVLLITKNLSAVAVFWNEWRYMSEPFFSDFVTMQRSYEQNFKDIILAGIAQKAFRPVNATFSTMAILSSLNGIQKWHNYTLSPEEMANAFADLFIQGLKT